MLSRSVSYIFDLSEEDTTKLAQLLTLGWRDTMSLQWFREQEYAIENFPSSLRRSGSLLSKLRMAVPSSKKAVLCSSHKGLNPFLIHRLFIRLTAECTTCQYRLSQNPHLPPNLVKFLDRIHAINSLWLSSKVYAEIFNVSSSQTCYEMIAGGCEACILAAVGSSDQMLRDLRAAMYGRKKKNRPFPRLFGFVDAWVKATVLGDIIREESEVLGTEIRTCRKQMRMARRQLARNIEEGIAYRELPGKKMNIVEREFPDEKDPLLGGLYEEDEKENDENTEDSLEDSVLNYYHTAGIQSTTTLGFHARSPTILSEDVHPSFRESFMTFDGATGTFAHRNMANQLFSTTLLEEDEEAEPNALLVSHTPERWNHFRTESSRGQMLRDLVADGMEPAEARQFVDKKFAEQRGKPSVELTSLPPQRPRTAYTESVYSRSQSGRADNLGSTPDVPKIPSRYGRPTQSRAVLGVVEEDEEDKRGAEHKHRRAQKPSALAKRETKWSDFK